MKIDSNLIVNLRNARSWSQEELAQATGLNLRTVQRIEREGAISLQSKKALASVFDMQMNELDYHEPDKRVFFEYKTVVLVSDVKWLSGWGKDKKGQGPYQLDLALNEFAAKGWKVISMHHGSSVHGGAGQVMVHLERQASPLED